MAEYVQLNGVRTWYDEQGSGAPLVLLHPGGVGVDSRAFKPNRNALASHFHIYLPERRGHGHTPDTDGPYSYELVAEDTIHFIEQVVGGPARLLGVSDGAVVALLVAKKRTDLVKRLICAAGVFHNSGWVPSAIKPSDEPPAFLVASYGDVSPDGKERSLVVGVCLAGDTVGEFAGQRTYAARPTEFKELAQMKLNSPTVSPAKQTPIITCHELIYRLPRTLRNQGQSSRRSWEQ